jgi:hypothetical protein
MVLQRLLIVVRILGRLPQRVSRVAQSIVERSGRSDYFFNNAGITVGGLIERYRIEDCGAD